MFAVQQWINAIALITKQIKLQNNKLNKVSSK